jgi:chemotaxis protein MotB
MNLIDTSGMQFLERFLDLSAYRQTLVAANLANIDTPGYQTRDIAFQSELAWASAAGLEQPVRPLVRSVYGLIQRPDGNNVSLEREGALLAETQLQYKIAVEFASSEVDKRRVSQLAQAIQEAFQQMGVFTTSQASPVIQNDPPISLLDPQGLNGPRRIPAPEESMEARNARLEEAWDRANMSEIQAQLEKALASDIKKNIVAVTPAKEGITVSLREIGFFDSGSTKLRPEAEPVISDFIRVVGPRHVRIRIEGHTDDVPIHNGRYDSNWELSTARATTIIQLFILKYHLAPDRLAASGYAQYHPVSSNASGDGRALNRRVDLVILNSLTEPSFQMSPSNAFPSSSPKP